MIDNHEAGQGPDEFTRIVGFAQEGERAAAADPYIAQYIRGVITVEELHAKLGEVIESIAYH